MGCNCGKPKCDGQCGCKSPAVLQINNPPEYITFHKVSVPAAMGDSTTNPPAVGKYKNVLLYYEADQTSWLYSTDGIPTKLTNGITNYEDAINLPQINDHTLLGNQSSSNLGLQGELTAGANIQINNNVISATDTTYTAGNGIELDGTEIKAKIGDGLEFDGNGEIDIADIEQYAHFFDNVADMKASENLIAGSYARTIGYYTKNDGGGATYKIRNITNDDVVDEAFIVEMGDGTNQLIAELVIENDEANVKQCGAYGDGTHDDYQAFNKACQHSKNVLIPSGTYKLNTTVTLTHNTNIYGKTAIVCWSGNTGNTDKTEIVTTDVYAFTCSWGNVNNFENITFNGKAINQPCGARINKCEFKGSQGLNNVRVSTVSECSFHNCSVAGIVKLTDSFIQNCFFYNNEIAIDMEDSGDNTIIGNKIEWNTLGIKMHDTVYAVIANNTFDRQSTYGISGTNVTNININGNNFERNLAMHILLSGSYITISNNGMFSKNSEDDQSGTVLPTVAMYLKSISNSLVKGNNVFLPAGNHTSKLFNAYPDYVSNVSIEGNILNGKNTDKFSVSMGTLTSSTTDSVNLAYDFSNVDYLGMTPWTVRLVLPRIVNNNITRSFTNKLFARITPNTAKIQYTLDPDDASREYTCYADLEITNKYAITI